MASGVAKDCTTDMLKEYLADKGLNTVEVEQLTKPEVVDQVRTLTFRVAVKASDYETAINPDIWPFRVAVRHYRPPRRTDRPDGGWQGQSGRSGGHVNTDQGNSQTRGNHRGGHGNGQQLPPGHAGRAGHHQQLMGPRQPGPVELSNFWNVLSALGTDMGASNF